MHSYLKDAKKLQTQQQLIRSHTTCGVSKQRKIIGSRHPVYTYFLVEI